MNKINWCIYKCDWLIDTMKKNVWYNEKNYTVNNPVDKSNKNIRIGESRKLMLIKRKNTAYKTNWYSKWYIQWINSIHITNKFH